MDQGRLLEGQAAAQRQAGRGDGVRRARRVKDGAPSAEGTARLLDADGLRAARRLLARKYTWQFWLTDVPAMVVRLGKRPHVGIAISF